MRIQSVDARNAALPAGAAATYQAGWLLLSALGTMLAALVLAGIIAGHAGVPISGGLLLGAAGLAGLPYLALVRRAAPGWPELAAVLAGITAVGGAGLALAWPSLLPLGVSVDAVHHLQLIDWIAAHGALPPIDDETRGLLGEMNAYPPGFALVALAVARAAGRPPLEAMYPAVALIGALVAGVVVALAARARDAYPGEQRPLARWLALLVAPLLLLAHRTFFMEAYAEQSYYTMVLGVLLALLAIGHALPGPRWAGLDAAQYGLALAALLATYPLWAPLPAVLAVAVLVRAARAGSRARALGLVLLAYGPALAVALLDVLPRLRTGQAVLAHEGLVALPTLARLIPIGLALPGAALLLLARRGRGLLSAAGLVLGAALALALLAGTGRVASYHAYKLLFLLTPLAAAIVAAAAGQLLNAPGPRAVLAGVGLALVLALTGSFAIVPPRPVQLLSPDLVAAARWLRATQPEAAGRAPVVGTPLGPLAYWLQIGLLGQRRDTAGVAQRDLTLPLPAAESWLVDTQQPGVALAAQLDPSLPGTHLLARFGPAGVLERDRPLDTEALNPLAIRYRSFWEDQRLKTAIELRQPLAGRLPQLEVGVYAAGAQVNRFVLAPDPQRTRPQFLGADLLPGTLGGEGYVNTSDFPIFAAPALRPTGALTLTLRLLVAGNSVDERTLATFTRAADGQITQLEAGSGELVYLRHLPGAAPLRDATLDFGGGLRLAGWDAPARAARGGALALELRWQALEPIDRALFPELQLLDPAGQVVASALQAPQGGFYPTWRWRVGETVADQRALALPAGLPAGSYRLRLRVHDFAAGRTLTPPGGEGDGADLGALLIE